jgi:transcriptional regulator with XRE-family HTH domain
MAAGDARERVPRTVLEQRIWERRETLEEFAKYAETFAREHGEPGTLSARHLDRLVSGRGENGKPLGRPRQVTVRLLERIFGITIDELLSAPATNLDAEPDEHRLRDMLRASARIDRSVITLLHDQLTSTRRLDRQLGAMVAHDEVITKTEQVTRLLSHSLTPTNREGLAALLSELRTLAGWQALDMGNVSQSWQHYEYGKTAARESGNPAFEAHTAAEQAFVLLDLGETAQAVELLGTTQTETARKTDRLLRAWLAAAHGEALAADGQRSASLHAFDRAADLLPEDSLTADGPYVVLDAIHLARWQGHALARVGDREAVEVLSSALGQLDPTFIRAETALRVDLATAFAAIGEREETQHHVDHAATLAADIGSVRQRRRLQTLNQLRW